MKKCPKCNTIYPEEAVFCSTCGTQLVHANICPECGNELPEGAKFCPRCGHKMFEEVKQEVVDEAPGANSRYTEAEIDQMRRELSAHRRRERSFKTAGGILLGLGIPLLILGIILLSTSIVGTVYDGGEHAGPIIGIVFGYLGVIFGALMIPASIPLLVVGSAVFGKKADNRERAIREYEGK